VWNKTGITLIPSWNKRYSMMEYMLFHRTKSGGITLIPSWNKGGISVIP
jgi:hypothetical protein